MRTVKLADFLRVHAVCLANRQRSHDDARENKHGPLQRGEHDSHLREPQIVRRADW